MYAVRRENVQTKTLTDARAGAINRISGFQALQTEMESSSFNFYDVDGRDEGT